MPLIKTVLILPVLLTVIFALTVQGAVTYTLQRLSTPNADQQDAYQKIEKTMDIATGYYNTYTSINKSLTVQYNTEVKTADASFKGNIRFGPDRSYMVVLTALHEIAHTVGIGTTTEYKTLIQDGVFTGSHATEMLRDLTEDPSAVLKGDQMHFWPYGLNYASEYTSDDDYIFHCKIVNAMYQDMFQEEFFKNCYLRVNNSDSYMSASNDNLVLATSRSEASLIQLIMVGAENEFKLDFGTRVLDIPNESKEVNVIAGLWDWNGGEHQKTVFEFDPEKSDSSLARIKMMHSGLYLEASGSSVVQMQSSPSNKNQLWELVHPEDIVTVTRQRLALPSSRVRLQIFQDHLLCTFPNNTTSGTIHIADLKGRTIITAQQKQRATIATTEFSRGVYIATLLWKGARSCKRFIVR